MYWLDNNTGITTAPDVPAVISETKRFFTNGGSGVPPSVPEDFWFHMIQEELLGVLTMAGIAPAKGDLNQVAKAIQSIAFSAYPIGAPIPWPTTVPPAGFLAMTGQSFSAVAYPKLAQAYPSLVLPDMRAEFIRGWDDGRGVDSGRSLLSTQSGSIESHAHRVTIGFNTDANKNVLGTSAGDPLAVKSVDAGTTTTPTSTRVEATGGAETRPRNIAYNYIVRAA